MCRNHIPRFLYAAPLLALCLVAALSLARAQSSNGNDELIRAAMLANLVKFVDWPPDRMADPQKPFVVGYLGDEPSGQSLRIAFQGKSVLGKTVLVQNIVTPQDAARCHLLFVTAYGRKRFRELFSALAPISILTVSDRPLGDPGMIIALPLVDDHIQIEIDLRSAQQRGFTISSRLLRIAAVTR